MQDEAEDMLQNEENKPTKKKKKIMFKHQN